MDIHVNAANNLDVREGLARHLEDEARGRLSRFEGRLTRVELHLGDEDSDPTSAGTKRCRVEARPAGMDPVAVSDHADTMERAAAGALGKMVAALERTFGKQAIRKGG